MNILLILKKYKRSKFDLHFLVLVGYEAGRDFVPNRISLLNL